MKQALISPEESVYKYDGTFLGERIAQVADQSFEVAPPLFWMECADDVIADEFYYDPATATIVLIPIKPPIAVEPVAAFSPLTSPMVI